ncbi:hypothetical protein PAL_GLEAN10014059 [Pteropus alecto]|uniref:Uncharacterized protein n=1 Tax=Pteropus alecto TaxID=9402 RepID=L5KED3_PTEAL|nr:hypothetical protein PAL_GLEAN10014059 [Pteropus alecto]
MKTERDAESSGTQVLTHTSCSSGYCSNLSPLSVATGSGFSLPIVALKHCRTPGCSGFWRDAAAAAAKREKPPHNPCAPPATWQLCGGRDDQVALLQVMRLWRLLERRAVFDRASSSGSCS